MKKKFLTAALLTFAALTLVVVTVFVTIAYLTASSAVSNVFTVGDVAITMFETKVDSDGTPVEPKVEVDTNSYHLVPGQSYTKDPTIRITSKPEDSMYLFVKSSNQIRKIEAGNQADATPETPDSMRAQMEANGWVEYVRSGDGIEIVWVYGTRNFDSGVITPYAVDSTYVQTKRNGTQGPVGEIQLCDEFTIASKAQTQLYAAAKVNFTAFAIQDSGFTGVQDAWEAVKETFPYEGGIINPVNPYSGSTDTPYDPAPGMGLLPIS